MLMCRLSNGHFNDIEKLIVHDNICLLHKTANEFVDKLEGGDEKEIGIELLHAWVKDLLGKRSIIIIMCLVD